MGLEIFGPNTTDYASWTPSPTGRGTWDILFSCIVTLGLCVYSAIHLNIPPPGATVWWKAGMKAKWLFIALLAPEFVVFNAWRQRSEAHHIAKGLRERAGQPEPRSIVRKSVDMLLRRKVPEPSDKGNYSLVHGFYIVMGGIRVDMSGDPDRVWPKSSNVFTLHSAAFLEAYDFIGDGVNLLEPADAIRDKSKADGLAKIVICVQAIWFCAQFFARLHQDLMITLIELNTLAHAICALLIYFLWWEKPLDIDRPTIIETRHTKDILDLCAFHMPDHPVSDRLGRILTLFPRCCYAHARELILRFDAPSLSCPDSNYFNGAQPYTGPLRISRNLPTSTFPWFSPPVPPFRGLDHLQNQDTGQRTFLFTSYDPPILHLKRGELLPGATMLRVRDKVDFVEMDEVQFSQLQRIDKLLVQKQFIASVYPLARFSSFSVRELNFQIHYRGVTDRRKTGLSRRHEACIGITIAGFFYGGLHALAWDSSALHLPVERTLWKMSCLSILCAGPYAALCCLEYRLRMLKGHIKTKDKAQIRLSIWSYANAVALIYNTLGSGITVLYLLCRLYLIVEVFINIAYLPPPAFETPNWSPYFPHIS